QTIIPVQNGGVYNTHFLSYGLGFFLSDVKGYKQASHTGGLPGNVTLVTLIPELELGIIVLTNGQEGGAFQAVGNAIKDSYLGVTVPDRVQQYAGNRKRAVAEAQQLTDSVWKEIARVQKNQARRPDFSPYLGTYRDPWFGDVQVTLKNGKPWFQSKRSPKLNGELFSYKGSTFVVRWSDRSLDADAFVSFTLDTEGRASGMTMKAVSPLTDFSYDFHDLEFKRVAGMNP
ncbi:MAG TPA: DUF3471 domain-containing protein, partial [Chitinophagaceae bacterium]|nr:DUF3471 domain-containing protein [Chitinophagaceae bacterium]